MATIKKKLWKEYFDAVVSGEKKAELRLRDFEAKKGDILILEEWDKDKKEYTGRTVEKVITYVSYFKFQDDKYWSKEDIEKYGIQIISME